ncbi:N-acetyltransferase family protein [Actinopolymorpha pittospori]
MQIRRAVAADVGIISAFRISFVADVRGVAESSLSDSFVRATRESHERGFVAGRLRAWLAAEGEGVVGVATVLVDEVPPRPEDDRQLQGFVTNLYVRPEQRGRGIGRQLMEACAQDALESGVRMLGLHTTDDGRRLYEKLGFRDQTSWLELAVDPL